LVDKGKAKHDIPMTGVTWYGPVGSRRLQRRRASSDRFPSGGWRKPIGSIVFAYRLESCVKQAGGSGTI